MSKIYAQHGDVCLEKIFSIPTGSKKIELYKGFVIEHGEGVHKHCLVETEGVTGYEKDGILYLCVEKEIPLLDHEEHKIMTISPGIYRKGIELEYDAEADEARRTQD
jgi:hypothetical protein